MIRADVVVVGGGPAGAACAITCARQGLKTVLLEKGEHGRHKVCGGVMPMVSNLVLKDDLGLTIPDEVMCSPGTLGLFYVPPSGRKSGAAMTGYRLLNVRRDRFDQWLCQVAADAGANVMYRTEFIGFESGDSIKVRTGHAGRVVELETQFLIGADGVFSGVRKALYPGAKPETMTILQEHWQAGGEFEEHFYTFLRGEITPAYGYVIPKDGCLVVGLGAPRDSQSRISARLERFKGWLAEEFAFQPKSLEGKEAGAIPYNALYGGVGNVVLIGDAAGFCNPFSGEGMRLGMESGIMAGEATLQVADGGELSSLYRQQIEGLSKFIYEMYLFTVALADEDREAFVSAELQRRPFA